MNAVQSKINMKEELDIEIPGEEDENTGDGAPKKKKEKKRKTKEEKIAERKVIFWTLIIVVLTTIVFWLVPLLKRGSFSWPSFGVSAPNMSVPKPEWKGYVEYKL